MKIYFYVLLLICLFYNCASYLMIPIDQSFYTSSFNGEGFIFIEDKYDSLNFAYKKGEWKITKHYIKKSKCDTSRMICFINKKDSLIVGYWYVKFSTPDKPEVQDSLLRSWEALEKKQYLSNPKIRYECVGFNIGSTLIPNCLSIKKTSTSTTYLASFFSGQYSGLIKVVSHKESSFSKEEFLDFFNSIRKSKNIDSLDLTHFKKMKASEL